MTVCCSPEPLRQVHRARCSSWRFLLGSAPPRSWEGPPHSVWESAVRTPHELRCCWKIWGVKFHVFLNKRVSSKKYPVIDGANLVCPAQLAILLAIFCTQLIWNLNEAFRDNSVKTGPKAIHGQDVFIMLSPLCWSTYNFKFSHLWLKARSCPDECGNSLLQACI